MSAITCHTNVYVGCKERCKYAGEVPTDSQVLTCFTTLKTQERSRQTDAHLHPD